MANGNTTHGYSRTRIYHIWTSLRGRCHNPNNKMYRWYGAKGVKVCKRWNRFENFLADMGEPPKDGTRYSIDRINNKGNYTPSNCKWSTYTEQARNKSNNVNITYKGKTQCLAAWAKQLNLPVLTLHSRLGKLGWTVGRAFTTPAGQQSKAVTYRANGHNLTIKEWSTRLGVSPNTLSGRIRYGWPLKRVFV